MTLASMTGFARATGQKDGLSWVWEVKSVNGKSLDLRCRLPQGFEQLEPSIREAGQRHFRRGSLQLALQIDRSATAAISINAAALEEVLRVAEELRKRLNAPPLTVEGLLAIRGIVEPVEAVADEAGREARDRALLASLENAFTALAASRAAEGAKIAAILTAQVDRIEALTIAARDCPGRSPEAVRARLADLVARIMDASAAALDPERLHQEAVLAAARADIQEELDRLFAHVEAARQLLRETQPVGRKFDFLAQEFNREANTLCSKANDRALTAIGLDLKTVIDQLREQVQNIE